MTQSGMRQYDDRVVGGPALHGAPAEAPGVRPDMGEQAKALQVLTMAQRTAEEHIETARRQAEQIRAEAHAAAQQIVGEAQSQADALRDEAEMILNRARTSAVNIAREAEAFAADAKRGANEVLEDAQDRAEEIVRQAQENAYDIKQRAEQIYEDVVGGLTSKRQALQGQIESLERFDQEYRARLATFMQQQMRALWVGQPQVAADEVEEAPPVVGELLPAARHADHDQLQPAADDDELDDDELEDERVPQPGDHRA